MMNGNSLMEEQESDVIREKKQSLLTARGSGFQNEKYPFCIREFTNAYHHFSIETLLKKEKEKGGEGMEEEKELSASSEEDGEDDDLKRNMFYRVATTFQSKIHGGNMYALEWAFRARMSRSPSEKTKANSIEEKEANEKEKEKSKEEEEDSEELSRIRKESTSLIRRCFAAESYAHSPFFPFSSLYT